MLPITAPSPPFTRKPNLPDDLELCSWEACTRPAKDDLPPTPVQMLTLRILCNHDT